MSNLDDGVPVNRPAKQGFRLAKIPIGASAYPTAVMLALGAELAFGALFDLVGGEGPSWLRIGLGAGIGASFLVVTVAAFRGFRVLREGQVTLTVEDDGLRLLRGKTESFAFLSHREISSLEMRRFPIRSLLVGSRNGRLWPLPLRHFDGPGDPLRLVDEIRSRISQLPGGVEQLRALDRRNAAGAWVASGWPGLSLIAVATLTVIASLQLVSGATTGESLMALGANSGERMLQGEFWRPWTAGLLHGSLRHIAANAFSLLLMGFLFERLFGVARFALLVGLSSLFGCLAAALVQPTAFGVGASAGLMGAIGAWMGLHLWRRKQLPGSLRLTGANLAGFLLMLAAAELVVVTTGHIAHLGGFLAGLVMLPVLIRRTPLHELREHVPLALQGAALLVGLGYLAGLISILLAAAGLSRV